MIIHSDWHIHSEYSYDATFPLEEIVSNAKSLGFKRIGITDHLNFNDEKFLYDLNSSVAGVKELQKNHPEVILGVELTPIEKPEFDYIEKILGHPWYNGKGIWYDDFSVIHRSMNMEIASALIENKKYVECNEGVLCSPMASEKFRRQYAEFMRELFEMGISITYGSDSHIKYAADFMETEKLLAEAGFREGDFSEVKEEDLW